MNSEFCQSIGYITEKNTEVYLGVVFISSPHSMELFGQEFDRVEVIGCAGNRGGVLQVILRDGDVIYGQVDITECGFHNLLIDSFIFPNPPVYHGITVYTIYTDDVPEPLVDGPGSPQIDKIVVHYNKTT